jgi:hypothetical protein
MKKLDNIVGAVVVIFMVLTLLYIGVMLINKTNTQVLVSKIGCCSITTQEVNGGYLVTWTDNTQLDTSYTEHVEVEYPDDDMTYDEQLQAELEWTVNEMMDLCYTHHTNW